MPEIQNYILPDLMLEQKYISIHSKNCFDFRLRLDENVRLGILVKIDQLHHVCVKKNHFEFFLIHLSVLLNFN